MFLVGSLSLLLALRLRQNHPHLKLPPQDHVSLVWGEIIPLSAQCLSDGTVGAVSTFQGLTRDCFENKQVIDLEYQAYEEMALKVLHSIIAHAKTLYPGLLTVVVIHRLGRCPVGETSLYIATTSSHRAPCLDALPFLVNAIKAQVPIWKLERYAHYDSVWKQNVL